MRILLVFFLFLLLLLPGHAQGSQYELGQELQNAAAAGDLSTVRRIIEGGFDVNSDLGGSSTVLHMAASWGRTEIVNYLLSKGADPTIRDSLNRTPEALARAMNHRETSQVLAAAEASSPTAVNSTSQSSTQNVAGKTSTPSAPQTPAHNQSADTQGVTKPPQSPPKSSNNLSQASGGPIPTGIYQGYDKFVAVGTDQTNYKEKLAILGGGRYERRWGGSQPGTYTYNAATGVITFTSGPYAEDGVTARFGKRGDGKPLITITYNLGRLGTDDDFFVLVSP